MRHINYKPWLVVFTASLFFFYEFFQLNLFNSLDHDLVRDFHLTAEQLGQFSSAYSDTYMLFMLPAGIIIDRVSTKLLILVALSCCVGGVLLFSGATTVLQGELYRALSGLGGSFCLISCLKLASRWFEAKRMALVSSLIVTMAMTGGMVAQAPMSHLVAAIGWRSALHVNVLIGCAIMVLIMLVVRNFPAKAGEALNELSAGLKGLGYWRSLRLALGNRQNWLCAIYTFVLNLPIAIFGTVWGEPYLTGARHLTETQAATVTSVLFLGTIIGSPCVGLISDKLQLRRTPMLVGVILSLAVLSVIIYSPQLDYTSLLCLFFLTGLTTSSQVLSYPVINESNSPMVTATALGAASMIIVSSYAIANPLIGRGLDILWQHHPHVTNLVARVYQPADFQMVLLVVPISLVVGLIAACLLKETHCQIAN